MIDQEQNGDPKPGFGKTDQPQNHQEADNSTKKTLEDKKKEHREEIEDTSTNNYGNIGVEGGVEDLEEDD